MAYSPLELAASYIQTGELADALDALTAHLDAQPDDDSARRMRIAVIRHLDRPEALPVALDDFSRLSEPAPEDALQHSVLLEQTGAADDALALLDQAHTDWPDDDRLTERYLSLLLAHDRGQEALRVTQAHPPTWRWLQWEGDAWVVLGNDAVATARYGLALAQLEVQVIPDNARYFAPIQARLLLARAAAYRRLDLLDQADEHYAAARQLVPGDPAIPFNRGLLDWLRGDPERALQMCRAALNDASDSLRTHWLDDLHDDPSCADLWAALVDSEA